MPKLLARVVRKGWQVVVAAGSALALVCVFYFSLDPTLAVLWSATELALDRLSELCEGREAYCAWFGWFAWFGILVFVIAGLFRRAETSLTYPLRARLARRICSRYPGFEAFRAREPESASGMETVLASMWAAAGVVTMLARGLILLGLTNGFGGSSPSPTGLPWLAHPIGVILDLVIVLHLATVWYRRFSLAPTLAHWGGPETPVLIETVREKYPDWDMFRDLLAVLGLSIIVPALEVSLNLWLY